MGFNDIDKDIKQKLKEREMNPVNTTGNVVYAGMLVSEPGTEKVILSTSDVDFMTCTQAGDSKKVRYCIVRKKQSVRYDKEPVNTDGHPVSIVTRVVFDAITSIVNNAGAQLRKARQDMDNLQTKVEMYEMTLDSLRKNGVID